MIKILLLLFTFQTEAAVDTCEALPEYTCSDARLNPGAGSGTIVRSNKENSEKLKIVQDSHQSLQQAFQKALLSRKSPPSEYDINIALSATGNFLSPACKKQQTSGNKKMSFACARVLAQTLARRANAEIFSQAHLVGGLIEPTQDRSSSLVDEDYLRNSSLYLQVKNDGIAKLNQSKKSKSLDARVEKIFKSSRSYTNQILDKKIQDKKTKSLLKAKINSIRFEGTDCSNNGNNSYNLNSAFIKNAYYDGTKNIFKYCKGFALDGVSDYHLIHIITHELAHAIDPCNIQKGPRSLKFKYQTNNPENEYPFKILSCLRSKGSVQAYSPQVKIRNPLGLSILNRGGRSDNEEDELPSRTSWPQQQQDAAPHKHHFCDHKDQIGESFSDWLGTEVLAKHITNDLSSSTRQQHIDGIASIWRPTCHDLNGLGRSNLGKVGSSPHPVLRDRLSHITLAHPVIRRHLGCKDIKSTPSVKYCGHNTRSNNLNKPAVKPEQGGVIE